MIPRPSYHITAPHNWLNDPNGPIHHNGRYHVFYQFNPDAPVWGPPHWGHVSSADLVHWDRHPVALSPGGTGPDADGIWSGCARVIDGKVALFYTGVTGTSEADWVESVCRADSSDDLMTWTRSADNPLIAGPPGDTKRAGHRDPFLVCETDGWSLLLGTGLHSGTADAAGAIMRYQSADLREWTYAGLLWERRADATGLDTGPLWECPQLLEIAGRAVLIWSVQDPGHPRSLRYAVYAVGQVSGGRFTADAMGRVDRGETFYAPAVTVDADGRPLMWGWLQEDDSRESLDVAHAGALSLPRELSLDGDRLVVRPALTPGSLGEPSFDAVVAPGPGDGASLGTPGHHFILTMRSAGAPITLELRWSAGGDDATIVSLEPGQLSVIDRVGGNDTPRAGYTMPLAASGREESITLFVDASILEIFTDDGTAMACRLPEHADPAELRIGGPADGAQVHVDVRVLPAHGFIGE